MCKSATIPSELGKCYEINITYEIFCITCQNKIDKDSKKSNSDTHLKKNSNSSCTEMVSNTHPLENDTHPLVNNDTMECNSDTHPKENSENNATNGIGNPLGDIILLQSDIASPIELINSEDSELSATLGDIISLQNDIASPTETPATSEFNGKGNPLGVITPLQSYDASHSIL